MKYRIVHRTVYDYEQAVTLCHNETHLTPRDSERQQCLDHRIEIEPAPATRAERLDFFGNPVLYFAIEEPHSQLTVTATSEVRIDNAGRQVSLQTGCSWEEVAARVQGERTEANLDARQYLMDSPLAAATAEIGEYAARSFIANRPLAAAVHDLMTRIHGDFVYDPDFTSVATPLSVVFRHRRGVCQDFAHLAIACLRSHGLPARYMSGYIQTRPAPGQKKLTGADASHAWFAVYDPVAGWLDYDPTNNQMPMDQYVTTAWGRDYGDITPLKGVIFGGGKHTTRVAVDVTPLE